MFAMLVALPLMLAAANAVPAESEEISFVVAHYDKPEQLQAIASQFQHLIVDRKAHTVRVEADDEDIKALRAAGFKVEIDQAATEQLRRVQRAMAQPLGLKSIPGFACYRTVEETYTSMTTLASQHPNLADVVDIGPTWEKTRDSTKGYTMKVLRLTNHGTDAAIPDKPNMVVLSSIHAREYTPAELNTRFGEWLVNGYGTDAEATWLLDNFRFHLILQGNPDGRKKAEAGSSWRKNTDTLNGSCSSSAYGVDMNRNFPFHWNTVAGGSSPDPCVETYHGPSNASEPETQNVIKYVLGIKGTDGTYTGGVFPDLRPDAIGTAAPVDYRGVFIDIHSYAQLVLWPWGDTSTLAPNSVALRTLGKRMAYFNGYSPEQSDTLYATDGASDDNAYGSVGVPAYTIELGVAFFENCSTFTGTTLPQNLSALRYAARNLQAPYQLPTGPDTVSVGASASSVAAGTPVTVTAVVNDSRFNQSNGAEAVQNITSAAAYVDKLPWQAGATPIALSASDGAFNATSETVTGSISTAGLSAGLHRIFVQGTDASGKPGTPNAVLLTVTTGANQPPVANFSYVANALAVTFSDSSSDPDGTIASRAWTFGDGATSTATSPSHTYAAAGNYTVTLTVTDNLGATNTKSVSISVVNSTNAPPVANFSFTTSALTATFTDASSDSDGTIASRSWTFGDSGTSTATSPSHTYAAAGTYNVALTVTDNLGATNTKTQAVAISPPPNVLQNGVAVTGLSAATGASVTYTMVVPSGATGLKFVMSGGTGDADMYVKFGSAPTTTVYDCRPYLSGNAETCTIATAQAGTYYVTLRAYAAFSGVSLTGSYSTTTGGPLFQNTTAMAIGDNTTIQSPITVSGVTGNAPAALKAGVSIHHTYQGDLKVDLIAPNGTTFNLWNRTGGGTDNIIQTFTVNASAVPANGVWKLQVNDNASGDTGTLDSWSLQF